VGKDQPHAQKRVYIPRPTNITDVSSARRFRFFYFLFLGLARLRNKMHFLIRRRENIMKLRTLAEWRSMLFRLLAAGALWTAAASASAHHSFAMFDPQHPMQVEGTVKSWEFTNPHSWLILMVMKGDTPIEYNIEGASVSTLIRQGFGPHTFSPGEKVTVTINPLKSGADGGAFVKAVKADGTTLTQSSTPN
jgi:hypothetical protein